MTPLCSELYHLISMDDAYKTLNIIRNSDGSFTRLSQLPDTPPTGYTNNPTDSQTVATIDVPLNTSTNTWIRIFHPLNIVPCNNSKLPIIVYFPGCGFVMKASRTLIFNGHCMRMAGELPAMILLIDYRLAPENRLPSAYEDAVDALLWLKQQALYGDEEYKFTGSVDFTKCFLMGLSSGGNIAYHVALRALNLDLEPIRIIGLIMDQPFFSGVERTKSELINEKDKALPLQATDWLWGLSLPIGADRDHEYCNPMVNRSNHLEINRLPRCYVNGYGGDPLIDRQKEFVNMLEGNGVCVVAHFVDDGFHGANLSDPEKAQVFVIGVREFIYSSAI